MPAPVCRNDLAGRAGRRSRHRPGCCPTGGLPWCSSQRRGRRRLGWLDAAPRRLAVRRSRCWRCRSPTRLGAPDAGRQARARRHASMADVMQVGDVVMVRARRATDGRREGREDPCRRAPQQLVLRQIPQVQGALVSLDPHHRPGAGDVGRLELREQPVQPRDAGAAAARIQLQAVRLPDRAGEGHLAEPALPGCALRHGHRATAAGGRTTSRWNFGGPTPLRVALEKSLNLVTLRVARQSAWRRSLRRAIAFHEVQTHAARAAGRLGAVRDHSAAGGRRLCVARRGRPAR